MSSGVGLLHAGEREPEGAQAPANHRRVEELAAVEIGEAGEQLRVDARAVVRREGPVPGQRRWSAVPRQPTRRRCGPALRSAGAGTVRPAGRGRADAASAGLPITSGAAWPQMRMQPRLSGLSGVAPHTDDLLAVHVDQHAAQCRMTVHRAHRAYGLLHHLHLPTERAGRPGRSGCACCAWSRTRQRRSPRAHGHATPPRTAWSRLARAGAPGGQRSGRCRRCAGAPGTTPGSRVAAA